MKTKSSGPLPGAVRAWFVQALVIAFTCAVLSGCTDSGGGEQIDYDKWQLWNQGTQLRGANIYQRRVYPELDGPDFLGPGPLGPPYSLADFDRLAAAGANYVNISHTGIYTQDPPYVVDTEAQANLDALLAMIEQADMFAVISFRSGPGRGDFALFVGETWYPASLINHRVWTDAAAQDAWVEMWRYAAQRYRNNPIVLGYDLMVEPNSPHASLNIFDPADFYPTYANTLYDWNQLYPRIVAGIREVDADTPIIIGAAGYSAATWIPYLVPVSDTRTAYAVHQYEPFVYTHQGLPATLTYPGTFDADGDGQPDQVNAQWLQDVLAPAASFAAQTNAPVVCNEYGTHRFAPGAAAYLADELSQLEALGMNHAIWLWDSSHPPQADEDNFNILHGPDPANHTDQDPNDLLTAVRNIWARNTVRPSQLARAARSR